MFLANFETPLAGTPCEAVLQGQMSHHAEGLQTLFQQDTSLVEWQAVSYCGVPLLDSSGAVVGHLAIIDDKPMPDCSLAATVLRIFAVRAVMEIERIRVEKALREEEKRYRDLYEEAPITYLSVGTDGCIKQANRRATELFRYAPEELIGRPVFDLYVDTPSGKARAREVFHRFLAGQETRAQEVEGRTADGQQVWISLSVKPLRDAAGQIVATRSTLEDITELKRAEAALRESQERLALVIESAMDAIVTMDEAERIVLFNTAAEKIFRCPAEQAIGQPFARFLSVTFRATLASYVQAFTQGGEPQCHVWAQEGLTARRADGEEFPLEATLSQSVVGGRNHFTVILRDIQERKRAEAKLNQLELTNDYLQEELRREHNFEAIIGNTPALLQVMQQVEQVAPPMPPY